MSSSQAGATERALPPTIPAMLQQAAARYGAREAVVDGAVTLSYTQLAERVDEAARALIALEVQFGDRVALWAPNLHEWIVAASAVHAVGGVLVPINTRMKGPEAADILARSGAVRLFCVGSFLGQDYPALLEGLRPATLRGLIVLREGELCRRPTCDGRTFSPGRLRSRRLRWTSAAPACSPTPPPTSCSPAAPPAGPRA